MNVLLANIAIDKHTHHSRVRDCRPGYDGLNQVYGPNHHTHPYLQGCSLCLSWSAIYCYSIWDAGNSICGINDIFGKCTIRNQFDILQTAFANVRKGKQICHTKVITKCSLTKVQWSSSILTIL